MINDEKILNVRVILDALGKDYLDKDEMISIIHVLQDYVREDDKVA